MGRSVVKYILLAALLGGCEFLIDVPEPSAITDGDEVTDAVPDADDSLPDSDDTPDIDAPATCEMTGCPGETPICAGGTCRGCYADDECPGSVCLLEGQCADTTRLLFAAPVPEGDGSCNAGNACTVDTAITLLTPTRDIIKLAPLQYVRDTGFVISVKALVAGAGATLQLINGTFSTGIQVTAGGDVTVTGLAINGNGSNVGLTCIDSIALRMHRVTATSLLAGAYSSNCVMEAVRSVYDSNSFYGLSVTGGSFVLENTQITRNGTVDSQTAALVLTDTTGTAQHLTVANNVSLVTGGIQCPGTTTSAIKSSIVRNNSNDSISGGCTVEYSIVDAAYPVDVPTNQRIDPMFIDPATNWHLMPASPAAGLGDPTSTTRIDFDAEARPNPAGTPPDPGFDEL